MHHGLKYNCLFTITDGDFWKSGWGDIVRELHETKEEPWTDPDECYEPSPSTSQMVKKTFCSGAIIVFTENHTYQSQSTGSS